MDEPTDADVQKLFKKIDRAAKLLNEAMVSAKTIWPEACYYLEDTANFMLLSGSSHDDGPGENSRQDRILHHTYIHNASGGGW